MELPEALVLRTKSGERVLNKGHIQAFLLLFAAQNLTILLLTVGLAWSLLSSPCTTPGAQPFYLQTAVTPKNEVLSRGSRKAVHALAIPTNTQAVAQGASSVLLRGQHFSPAAASTHGQLSRGGVKEELGAERTNEGLRRKLLEGLGAEAHDHFHVYGMKRMFLPPDFITFEALLQKGTSDKKVQHYGHMYNEYLDPLRLQQDTVNMLEIGLRYGNSVDLWKSAFKNGKIYGLEYNPTIIPNKLDEETVKRVHVFYGDQANATLLEEISEYVRKETGLLDFITDDGGHTMVQQITSFTYLFPLVKPGGVYFIEDLQTSYWEHRCHHYWNHQPYCYGGGPPGKKGTTIDLMKSLIDVMNADFMEDHVGDQLGTGTYSVNPVDSLVGSVQCWRNMCAIRRKTSKHF